MIFFLPPIITLFSNKKFGSFNLTKTKQKIQSFSHEYPIFEKEKKNPSMSIYFWYVSQKKVNIHTHNIYLYFLFFHLRIYRKLNRQSRVDVVVVGDDDDDIMICTATVAEFFFNFIKSLNNSKVFFFIFN